ANRPRTPPAGSFLGGFRTPARRSASFTHRRRPEPFTTNPSPQRSFVGDPTNGWCRPNQVIRRESGERQSSFRLVAARSTSALVATPPSTKWAIAVATFSALARSMPASASSPSRHLPNGLRLLAGQSNLLRFMADHETFAFSECIFRLPHGDFHIE